MTTIVNVRKEECDVYCGRGSIFGSPFEIGRDGNRKEVIEKYRRWFNFLIKDDRFTKELIKLKDKRIGCFCVPAPCHLEIIRDWLDSNPHVGQVSTKQ